MTIGSLFAGIGGFDLGFERAGMQVAWQCESDLNARAILARHWPSIHCHPDIRGLNEPGPVDVVCGGFPCQDLSTANSKGRAGLGGERSGLWFEMLRVIRELRPAWVVAENVPGLLSSNRRRDFGTVLSGLAELGYGVAYRVLDSQFFGVAQRRRRVFIVGHLGTGRAAEILLEPKGLRGDTPTRQGTRTDDTSGAEVSPTPRSRFDGSPNVGDDALIVPAGFNAQEGTGEECYTRGGSPPLSVTKKVAVHVPEKSFALTTPQGRCEPSQEAYIAWHENSHDELRTRENAYCLNQGGDPVGVANGSVVRRLTPTECARLQGFPEDWNDCQSDTARYRQFGNAVTVNVAEWIGHRIMRAA